MKSAIITTVSILAFVGATAMAGEKKMEKAAAAGTAVSADATATAAPAEKKETKAGKMHGKKKKAAKPSDK